MLVFELGIEPLDVVLPLEVSIVGVDHNIWSRVLQTFTVVVHFPVLFQPPDIPAAGLAGSSDRGLVESPSKKLWIRARHDVVQDPGLESSVLLILE